MVNPLMQLMPTPVSSSDVWRWATVESVSPIRVRLDGDDKPLPVIPDVLCRIYVGARVRVHVYNRRIVITGVKDDHGPKYVVVDGVKYQATGRAWIPTHSLTAWNNLWISPPELKIDVSLPPSGWGLIAIPSDASGYKALSMIRNDTFRYFSTNSTPIKYVVWSMVYTGR